MTLIIRIALFSILVPIVSIAEDKTKHQEQQLHDKHKIAKGVEALTHELRDLLTKEMQSLQTGMMSIIPAYISGDWAAIASTAKKNEQ